MKVKSRKNNLICLISFVFTGVFEIDRLVFKYCEGIYEVFFFKKKKSLKRVV